MSTDLPYAAEVTDTAGERASRFGELEPGIESGQTAAIAGRLMLRRVQGKLAFGTIADHTGRIQLFAPSQSTQQIQQVHLCLYHYLCEKIEEALVG